MPTFWDRHSDADKAAMKALLMPLVAASRSRDFVDVAAARVQIAAFMQALADCPRAIVEEAVSTMVARGVVWMPKPGELKAECARLMQLKLDAIKAHHLRHCDHSLQLEEFTDVHGVPRMRKCEHWNRAQKAMDEFGQPIALPPAQQELQDSQVW